MKEFDIGLLINVFPLSMHYLTNNTSVLVVLVIYQAWQ